MFDCEKHKRSPAIQGFGGFCPKWPIEMCARVLRQSSSGDKSYLTCLRAAAEIHNCVGEIDQSKKIQKERPGYYRFGVMPGGHKEGGWLHEGGYKVLGDGWSSKNAGDGRQRAPAPALLQYASRNPQSRGAGAPDDRKAQPIRGAGSQPEPSPMASRYRSSWRLGSSGSHF
jgi:hypothetical protein